MIIPSIDLMGGQAVQLIGGEKMAIEAGDPRPLAEYFGRVGDIAVIDLDAALSQGNNAELIRELLKIARCRVGGGIRDVETAIKWLDAGAEKIILGTAAKPEILKELPKDRVLAALDARHGEVVIEGWRTKTGAKIADRMAELDSYVGGYLVTFVESEGRMEGINLEAVEDVIRQAGPGRVTIAGGVTTPEDLAAIDRLGADAQVGMALYSGKMSLAAGFAAPLRSDREDGLWPTIVSDVHGEALGLVFSNLQSLEKALQTGTGVYWSRRRGLWEKGKESGNTQKLLRVEADCDRDCLRFIVEQTGAGFCHLQTDGCFGDFQGLKALQKTLRKRYESAPEGSYTKRLFDDPELLGAKLREEAEELLAAKTPDEVAWEAADLIYFAMTVMTRHGVTLADVERQLDERAKKVTRRPGNAK